MDEIKCAREFYGIYDFISDSAVKRLIDYVKTQSMEWIRDYIYYMDLSYKLW